MGLAFGRLAADQRRGLPACRCKGLARLVKRLQHRRVREIDPGGVPPHRRIQIGGQRDAVIPDSGIAEKGADRIAHHLLRRDFFVQHLIDKRTVGAVFQQAAHQIGQQILMHANGRIDAAAVAMPFHDKIMQPLPHAMQALKFEILHPVGHLQDGGDGMGVMGRELRVDVIRHIEQLFRAGEIAHIRRRLAGEDGISLIPHDLRQLDLRIPIGALDQPHHDLAVMLAGQRIKPVQHIRRARAIGLHHDAEAVPAFEVRACQHGFDYIEGEIETVRLLRVDVEAHIGVFRLKDERGKPRHQLMQDAVPLRIFIARMQGRQLDGNAGIHADIGALAVFGDTGNRL